MALLRSSAASALDAELAEIDRKIDKARADADAHRHTVRDASAALEALPARQVAGDIPADAAQREAARLTAVITEESAAARYADRVADLLVDERATKTSHESLAKALDALVAACRAANDASAAFAVRPTTGTAEKLTEARTARDAAVDRYRGLQSQHADATPLPDVLDEPDWPADRNAVAELLIAGPQRPLAAAAKHEAERAASRREMDMHNVDACARGSLGISQLRPELHPLVAARREALRAEEEARLREIAAKRNEQHAFDRGSRVA